MRFFVPILAGANLPDRLLACLGAALGIGVTGLLVLLLPSALHAAPFLVAPMGASAVLVFAVPASPLAQPWPVIGGNVLSCLVGVAVVHVLSPTPLAAGIAVGAAILAMSLLRCLHPPGGAAALLAVLGGPAVLSQGYAFPLVPVGLDAVLLVLTGILFHRFSGHSYPHGPAAAAAPPGPARHAFHPEDVENALSDLGETFDVGREDLDRLLDRVARHAQKRTAEGGR